MNSKISSAIDISRDVNLLATKKDIKFILNDINSTIQFEPAVVLDIILDELHPEMIKGHCIDINQWSEDCMGEKPSDIDYDFTWIGRAKIRLLNSQPMISKEGLQWAMPLDNNISEFPLVNEIVAVVNYQGSLYYTKKINYKNFVNTNSDFGFEMKYGAAMGNREELSNPEDEFVDFKGPVSKLTADGGYGFQGALGRYFLYNPNIRSLKRFEGDTLIESRFGSSVRFGSYDDVRENDKGYSNDPNAPFDGYDNYAIRKNKRNNKNNFDFLDGKKYEVGGGNPMILIRNRQRPLKKNNEIQLHAKLPAIPKIDSTNDFSDPEKNVGGYLLEDINNDGSSIHITSGCTISKFVTTCYKQLFSLDTGEEVNSFCPWHATEFKYPVLNKDQIVINSDRIILSSRFAETFHYSKKRYSVVTDNEYTVDAHQQIVLTSNTKTVINSPAIYLGQYDETNEPALLGQTSVDWLYDLCEWLKIHTHLYEHSHPDAGNASPNQTQERIQLPQLIALQNRLDKLLSRRVFVTGGGYAPGDNGGKITDGTAPVSINTTTGQGVPGGFKGSKRRERQE